MSTSPNPLLANNPQYQAAKAAVMMTNFGPPVTPPYGTQDPARTAQVQPHPMQPAPMGAPPPLPHPAQPNAQGISHPPDGGAVRSISPITEPTRPQVAPMQPHAQTSLADDPNNSGIFMRPAGTTQPMPILPPDNTQVNPPSIIDRDQAELARKVQTGSGISQIHSKIEDLMPNHPLLGKILGYGAQIPATLADVGASAIAPAITANLPGTEYHHDRLVAQGQRQLGQDVNNAEKQAQIEELQARTEAAKNPPDEITPLATDEGYVGLSKRTGEAKPITVNGETAQPIDKTKQQAQNVHVLPDGKVISVHTDKDGKSTAEVVYQGDPALKTEVKQIEVKGKPHQVLVNAQTGETIKDLGETGEKPPTVNVNAGNAELDRISGRLAKPYQAGYEAGSGSLERIDLTKRNVDAGYVGQGLGIPELLTALVSGKGTGVRITQPELNAITRNRGIKGDAESFFNSIAGKGALTAEDKAQIKGVLQDAETKLRSKMQINSDALDAINGAGSREDAVRADREARQRLNELVGGGAEAGKSFSLKNAMALPFNKGKSEADVRKDLEAHGYKVVE